MREKKDRNGGIKTIQIRKGETIERLKPEDEGKEKRLKPYNQPDGCTNYNSSDGSAATFPKGQGQNHLNLASLEKNSTAAQAAHVSL